MDKIFNIGLLRHPVNWGMVILMWMLGAMLLTWLMHSWSGTDN